MKLCIKYLRVLKRKNVFINNLRKKTVFSENYKYLWLDMFSILLKIKCIFFIKILPFFLFILNFISDYLEAIRKYVFLF